MTEKFNKTGARMKRSSGLDQLDVDLSRRPDPETEFVLYRGRWMVLFTIVTVSHLTEGSMVVAHW